MEKIIVSGGLGLTGEINVQGAKNAVLPILAACVLIDGKIILHNVPRITDTFLSIDILKCLGADVDFKGNTLYIDCTNLKNNPIPEDIVCKMRSSIIFLGSMLGRFGEVAIHYPGGCKLGARAIDLHLKGLNLLGGQFEENAQTILCKSTHLKGNIIDLDFPSVGATQNIILGAVYARGLTMITNAATEPEIVDLINFLNKCGAVIRGAGTSTLIIAGVIKLGGCEYEIMPDRIVAGSYIAAAAITKSHIRLKGINPDDMAPIIAVFREMGMDIKCIDRDMYVRTPDVLRPISVKTLPHPGFPTDMQPQLMSVLSTVTGTSVIEETIFEARDMHVDELIKMGANITRNGQTFTIEGGSELHGDVVFGKDLRGTAALIIAGLVAKGETTVYGINHLQRGYEDLVTDLSGVSASVRYGYLEEESA